MYDTNGLFRLVYRSRSALKGSAGEVEATLSGILEASQRRNGESGITGALMFTRSLFVQALEGPAAAVEAAFDRICCDLRHTDLEVVECSPILERGFGDWSMRHLVPHDSTGETTSGAEDASALSETAIRAMKLMVVLAQPLPPARRTAPSRSR